MGTLPRRQARTERRRSVVLTANKHPVLLLHGQPGSPRDWDRVVSEIGARAQTLAITRPGWAPGTVAVDVEGNAIAARVALDQAGVARAVVVGHSFGGAVAAWLAAAEPDRVVSLVLVAPAADTHSITALDRLLAAPVLGDVLSAALLGVAGGAAAAGPVRRAIGSRLGIDPRYLRSSAALLRRRDAWRSFVAEQRALIGDLPALEQRLADIIAPTTVVAGTADHVVSIASARAVAHRIRGASVVELAGAHHLLAQQRPAELAEIIVAAAGL
jgi:pimeloyl-ACP methyl ester carboxylesterase